MPVLLHGGSLCPLEVTAVLSGVASSWTVVAYLWARMRHRKMNVRTGS